MTKTLEELKSEWKKMERDYYKKLRENPPPEDNIDGWKPEVVGVKEKKCVSCNGTGYRGIHGNSCSRCEGSGMVEVEIYER